MAGTGPYLILLIQTKWLLPVLDERALLTIHGQDPGPSQLHVYYVTGEVLKVSSLVVLGVRLFSPCPRKGDRHHVFTDILVLIFGIQREPHHGQ